MSSRKKLTISLTVVALVIVAAVVAVVGVLAATQQAVQSTISIRFVATDIEGSVSARYEIMAKTADSEGKSLTASAITPTDHEVTFAAADTTVSSGIGIEPAAEYTMKGRDQAFYIEYFFTRASVDYVVDVLFTGNLTPDFEAQYWDTTSSSWKAISESGSYTRALSTIEEDSALTTDVEGTTLLTRIYVADTAAGKNIEATGSNAFGFSFRLYSTTEWQGA